MFSHYKNMRIINYTSVENLCYFYRCFTFLHKIYHLICCTKNISFSNEVKSITLKIKDRLESPIVLSRKQPNK